MYILECNNGSYYVGHTDNLEKRLAEHQDKTYTGYTSLHVPIKLVYQQALQTRDEAFQIERKIKNWSRNKKEALIKGDFDALSYYAKKKF